MNFEHLKGKQVTVKSTGQVGIIKEISVKLNGQKIRTARFIIDDPAGRPIEYMPHEVEFLISDEERERIEKERNTVINHEEYLAKHPLTQIVS